MIVKKVICILTLTLCMAAMMFAGTVTGNLMFDPSLITYKQYEGYDAVSYNEETRQIVSLMDTGKPALPYVLMSVVVPANAEFAGLTYSNEHVAVVKTGFNALPFQGLYQNGDKVGQMGVDSVDVGPDMMVGRMPFNEAYEIDKYIDKMNRYINAVQNNPAFTKRTLMIANDFFNSGDSEARLERIFREGISPRWDRASKQTNYRSDDAVQDETSVADSINFNSSLILHAGHANVRHLRLESGGFHSSVDFSKLNNIPGVFVSTGCRVNKFDDPADSFGEELLKYKNGGALVSLCSVRDSYIEFSPLDNINSVFSYMFNFTKELLYNWSMPSMCAGDAYFRMMNYVGNVAIYDDHYRWTQYTFSYLGDPTFVFYKDHYLDDLSPEPLNSTGYTIHDVVVDHNGVKYFIGEDATNTYAFKWDNDKWTELSASMTRIEVGLDGTIWLVDTNNNLYRRTGMDVYCYQNAGVVDISAGKKTYIVTDNGKAIYTPSGGGLMTISPLVTSKR